MTNVEVFDAFVTHASPVYDVTDKDCRAKNGKNGITQEHSRLRFRDFQTSIFNKQDEKLCAKMLLVYFFNIRFIIIYCSIPVNTGPVMLPRFGSLVKEGTMTAQCCL